jgi:tetratricopeptide (TPR) repeat protein
MTATYSEAEAEYILARDGYIGIGKADDPAALQIRSNLAAVYSAQEKFEEATAEHLAVLTARGRVLPANHPDIFQSQNNYGLALGREGKLQEARVEIEAALNGRIRVLPENARDTLRSHYNMAVVLEKLGDEVRDKGNPEEARKNWQEGLQHARTASEEGQRRLPKSDGNLPNFADQVSVLEAKLKE